MTPKQALPLGDNSNGKEKKKKNKKNPQHYRSLGFLNRPPAIFTTPEIAVTWNKTVLGKPEKQKNNLQAAVLTEGLLFAS